MFTTRDSDTITVFGLRAVDDNCVDNTPAKIAQSRKSKIDTIIPSLIFQLLYYMIVEGNT